MRIKDKKEGLKVFGIFALPGLFVFAAVVIIPFLYGLYLTFTDWNGISSATNLVGFDNYVNVFKDTEF